MEQAGDDVSLIRRAFAGRRLPIILQSEAAECGLAALAMVACYHGHASTLSELRRRFAASLKGTTLRALMDMADTLGLSSRPIRLELAGLAQVKTPAILHWDLRHFVVLRKATSGVVVIHDPAFGERRMTIAEASRHFTGVALELTPTPAFVRRPETDRVKLGDLFNRARGLTPTVVQLFVLAVVLQAFGLLSPIFNQTIVDDVLGRGDADLLVTVAAGMIILLLINTAITRLRGYIGLYMNTQLSYQLQANLLRHTLRLPVSWFEKRHVGDILSRFGSLSPAQGVMTDALPNVLLDSMMALFSVGMMVIYAPSLTAIEVATIIFFFAIRMITFPYYRQRSVEGLHLSAKVQSTFLETLRGARTFKAFGRERERIAVWQNEQAAAINNNVRVARFSLWGGVGTGLLAGVQQIIVWFLGAKMVIDGRLTIGMLFAYQAYTSQFTGAAGRLVGQFFNFRTLGIHLERLADIVHADPEKGVDEPMMAERSFNGAVAVKDLSFRYAEHEAWVLRDLNINIAPGEFVCFIGPSGQGKTTLLKLFLGFYEPTDGEVLIDGAPLRVFGLKSYRNRIGVVLQDDQLFAGTIADNISFFDPDYDIQDIEAAARKASIHDDIMRLPMGYMTLVGDMGSTLSGGQRQRVFIARALYRNPTILFMDEGTANLDPASERAIMETLNGLSITRVMIAHRPAAIAGAHRILRVENGQIQPLSVLDASRAI